MPRVIVVFADACDAQKGCVVRPIPLHKGLLGYEPRLCPKRKLQSLYWWSRGLDGPFEVSRKVYRFVRLRSKGVDQTHRGRLHIVVRVVERDGRHDCRRLKLRRGEYDQN